MIYFIPWVVLLLGVILAIPLTAMIEKRKMQAAYGGYDDDGSDADEGLSLDDGDEELTPLDDGGDAILDEGTLEPAQNADDPFDTGAPDDFSAFDEEFK